MSNSPSVVTYSENILVKKLQGYFYLMKPRVMILVIFTAFVGMMLAPETIMPLNYFYVLLAVTLGAGSSAAINMWFDEDIDKSMERTKTRPIPLGIISKNEALIFGILTGILSLFVMYYASNTLATGLLLFTILFYVVIYTFWLKRSTSLNIVIGGAAGAIPPIIGWAAVIPEICTLREAIDLAKKSKLLPQIFHPDVLEHYIHAAQWEQSEYDKSVNDWEHRRYFERG